MTGSVKPCKEKIKKRNVNGTWGITYATLETRVKKILHAIEILIDEQRMHGSQDGIRISQTADFRHNITGFDIQDIIGPVGAICTRIKHIESRGHGWVDFIPSIDTTVIFGRGFGDLIRPEEPLELCRKWRTVPINEDYMAASVSTLQTLYQKRLIKMELGLRSGETSNVIWASLNHPFKSCECLRRSNSNTGDGDYHIDSVQFLVAKGPWSSWKLRLIRQRSKSVDVMTLDEGGAVVFGHISALSFMSEGKSTTNRQDESLDGTFSVDLSSQGMPQPSSANPAVSELVRSAGSTGITPPRIEASRSVAMRENKNLREDITTEGNKKSKRWKVAKKAFRKFID